MRTNLPVTDKKYVMADGLLLASKTYPKGVSFIVANFWAECWWYCL